MDRKLLDYLPPVLREVLDFQAINGANEPEIAIAWDALTLVLANQFLETADVRGVSIWEKELGLLPKNTESLVERKTRIKAKWNMVLPYSLTWLRNWLTSICGPDGHEETVKDYTLFVSLYYDPLRDVNGQTTEILDILRATVPVNIQIRVADRYWPVPFLDVSGKLFVRSLVIPLRVSNTRRTILRLDGQKRLDGSWYLDQADPGIAFVRVGLAMRVPERETVSGAVAAACPPVRNKSRAELIQTSAKLGASNTVRTVPRTITAGIRCRQSYGLSGTLTRDRMWRLDGSTRLDGARKLNASIVKEEL